MSTPFGTAMSAQRRKTAEYLEKSRTCIRCERTYREMHNLGAHGCPNYHPYDGAFDARGRYLCCRRPRGFAGCVAADHTDGVGERFAVHADEMLTDVTGDDALFVASLSGRALADVKRDDTWTFDAKNGVWRVARIDIARRAVALHRQYDIE